MKKTARILAIFLTLAMLMGVMSSCDILMDGESFVGLDNVIGLIMGKEDKQVMTTNNFEIRSGTMRYFFIKNYIDFKTNYGAYFSYLGLDENVPLDEQSTHANSSISSSGVVTVRTTWLEYFTEAAVKDARQTLALCEYAYENGVDYVQLEEEDQLEVEKAMAAISGAAPALSHICLNITEDDVAKYLHLKAVADCGIELLTKQTEGSVGENEARNAYENDSMRYDVVDYLSYTFEVDYDDIAKRVMKGEFNAEDGRTLDVLEVYNQEVEALRTKWEALVNTHSEEEFISRISEIDKDFTSAEDYVSERVRYGELEEQIAAQLFGGSRYDTFYNINENSGEKYSVTVYMILASRYQLRSRNFIYATFGTASEAEAMINSLKAQGSSRDIERTFIDIAEKSSAVRFEKMENYVEKAANKSQAGAIGSITYKDGNGLITDKYYYAAPSVKGDYTYIGESSAQKEFTSLPSGGNYTIIGSGDSFSSVDISNGNAVTVKPGQIEVYKYTSSSISEIEGWVFDKDRELGDLTDTPIPVGINSEYAVAFYMGEGEYCWYVEIKEQLVKERYDEALINLEGWYGITIHGEIDELFSYEDEKSGFFDFLDF